MPYINARITESITLEKENIIKTKLGEAITVFSGKSENWLMVDICPDCHIWFRGDNSTPAAFVEVKIFGTAANSACEKMTEAVCDIFTSELDIPADRIYVKYESCHQWGWNGSNF